jgi:long-chain acyl-CoA synthetase
MAESDLRRWRNLPEMFLAQAERLADKPFLWRKNEGAFRPMRYGEAARQVRHLAGGLAALGVGAGDRVALVAENRPEWAIADLAIMALGAVTVPAFTTNTTADHRHVLTHSGAKGAIVSSRAIAGRLLPAALESPELKFVIGLEPLEAGQAEPFATETWQAVLAAGAAAADDMAERIARIARDDTCCIIYTSGTGGTPKGVMLSHGAILCNCAGAIEVLAELGLDDEVFLSFLPLSHSYEHTAGQFLPIAIGGQIYYAESVDKLMDNMAEARPTLMLAVPRLYEVMHQRIQRAVDKTEGPRRRLFEAALALGRKRLEDAGGLSLRERLVDLAAELLVRRKLRHRFGGRLKALVSGGAALNYELGMYFTALGMRLLQGYGQTESAPIISVNLPSRPKLRTVGPPLRDVQVRIAEDGEILARGGLVMKGYWRDPAATEAALRDGWLHTGDIGAFDADGDLRITDRKKDIIVFSGGDNVSPARIEGMLILQREIAQAMVHGDKRPHLVALLVPDADFAAEWARENGRPNDPAALADDAAFGRALGAAVDRVNTSLSVIERVRRFAVAAEPFTIDNGMMTPSLKIRRHKIRERHGDAIDRLYEKAG